MFKIISKSVREIIIPATTFTNTYLYGMYAVVPGDDEIPIIILACRINDFRVKQPI